MNLSVKKCIFRSLGVLGLIVLATSLGFAQDLGSDDISKGLDKLINWLTGISGAAVIVGGIIVGVQMAMGDERAPGRMKWVVGGAVCILVARVFWSLLRGFFNA